MPLAFLWAQEPWHMSSWDDDFWNKKIHKVSPSLYSTEINMPVPFTP